MGDSELRRVHGHSPQDGGSMLLPKSHHKTARIFTAVLTSQFTHDTDRRGIPRTPGIPLQLVEELHYKPADSGFHSRSVHWILQFPYFSQPHFGPEVNLSLE